MPNSVPDSVKSFSLHLELSYELPISHANISNSFKYSSINVILTLSMDTTPGYVINDGGYVFWPSVANLAFLVNFPSILI